MRALLPATLRPELETVRAHGTHVAQVGARLSLGLGQFPTSRGATRPVNRPPATFVAVSAHTAQSVSEWGAFAPTRRNLIGSLGARRLVHRNQHQRKAGQTHQAEGDVKRLCNPAKVQ